MWLGRCCGLAALLLLLPICIHAQPCFNGDTQVSEAAAVSLSEEERPGQPGFIASSRTYAPGSYIIPMDNLFQGRSSITCLPILVHNLYAYGLVNHLLNDGIPVDWVIRNNKGKDDVDLFNVQTVEFSGDIACLTTINLIALVRDYRGGPFVIDSTFRAAVEASAATYAGGGVVLHRALTSFTGDVRHELRSRPFVGVSDADQKAHIHELMLTESGFIDGDHFTRINSDDLANIGTTSCLTIVTEPHFGENAHIPYTSAARTFLESGGNMLAQCAAIETYEQAFFWSTMGIDVSNGAYPHFFENPSLAFSQFIGDIDNTAGSVRDWTLETDSVLRPESYVVVGEFNTATDRVGEKFSAVVSQLDTIDDRLGGMLHYLGGHEFDRSSQESINSVRMYMNAVLTPTVRPDICGFQLGGDLVVSVTDSSDAVNPLVQSTQYVYTAENIGGTSIAGVVLDIVIDPSLQVTGNPCSALGSNTFQCTVGTLGPGASSSFTFTVQGEAIGLVGTTVAGTTSSAEEGSNTGNNFACEDTRVCDVSADGAALAKLDLTPTGVRPYMSKGEIVQFTISIENGAGISDLTNVEVTEIPTSFDIVGVGIITPGTSFDLDTLVWSVPFVGVGLRAFVVIDAKSNVDGINMVLTNEACITRSDQHLSGSPICSTYTGISPPFLVSKTATESIVADSQEYEYNVRILNPTAISYSDIGVFDFFPTATGVMARVLVGTYEVFDVIPSTFLELFDDVGSPTNGDDVEGTDDDDWGTGPQSIVTMFGTEVLQLDATASDPSGIAMTISEPDQIEDITFTIRYRRDSMDSAASLTYLNTMNAQTTFAQIPQGDDSAFITETFTLDGADVNTPNPVFGVSMGPPLLPPSTLYVDSIQIDYSVKNPAGVTGPLEPIVPNQFELIDPSGGLTLGGNQQIDINYRVSITATRPGTATNNVQVTSTVLPMDNMGDIVPVVASVDVEVLPNMVITKTADADEAREGDIITYTVDIAVNFPLSQVNVIDSPGPNMLFVPGSATTTEIQLRGAASIAVPAQAATFGPVATVALAGPGLGEWDSVTIIGDTMTPVFDMGAVTHFVVTPNAFSFDDTADDPMKIRLAADFTGFSVVSAALRFQARRTGADEDLVVKFNDDKNFEFDFPANGEVDGAFVLHEIPDVEEAVNGIPFFVDFFVDRPMAGGSRWDVLESVELVYQLEQAVASGLNYPILIDTGAFTTAGTASFTYQMEVTPGAGPLEVNTVTGTTTTVTDIFTGSHELTILPQIDVEIDGPSIVSRTIGATLDYVIHVEMDEGAVAVPSLELDIIQAPCQFDFVSAVATFGGITPNVFTEDFATTSTFPGGPWNRGLCLTCIGSITLNTALDEVSTVIDVTGITTKSALLTVNFQRGGGSLVVIFESATLPSTTPLILPGGTDASVVSAVLDVTALMHDMTTIRIRIPGLGLGPTTVVSVVMELEQIITSPVATADPNFNPLVSFGLFSPGDTIDVMLTMAVPDPVPGGTSCTLTAGVTGGDTDDTTVSFISIVDDSVVTIQGRDAIFRVEENDVGPIAGGTITISSAPSGTAAVSPLFNGRVFYQPPTPMFSGMDTFVYTKCDTSNTVCDSATVTVDVQEVVIAANDGVYDVGFNDPTVLTTVLDNDSGDFDPLSITIVSPMSLFGNSVTVTMAGEVEVTWGANPLGPRTDSFDYEICGAGEMDFDTCDSPNRFNCDTATVDVRLFVCVMVVRFNHECNGRVTLTEINGTAPFTYNWMAHSSITDTTQAFQDDLPPDSYFVEVTDAFGCTVPVDIELVRAQVPPMLMTFDAFRCSGATEVSMRYVDNYACTFGDLEFEIDWGDGSPPDTYTPGPPDILRVGGFISVTHRYVTAGSFNVNYMLTYTTASGTDLSGFTSGTVTIDVGADVGRITAPPRLEQLDPNRGVVAVPVYHGVEITWTLNTTFGDPDIPRVDISLQRASAPDKGTIFPLETDYRTNHFRYVWTPHHLFSGWYNIRIAVPAPELCIWNPVVRVRLYTDIGLYCQLPVDYQYVKCDKKRGLDGSVYHELGESKGPIELF